MLLPLLIVCSLLGQAPGPAGGRGPSSERASRDLFVSSRNTHSVKRFDGGTGEFLGDFVAAGAGGLESTQEVAFGPDGHLYVTGRGNAHVLRFDGERGHFLGPFTSGLELDEPTKMTFGPDGRLYVSQWGRQRRHVVWFDARTGAYGGRATRAGLEQGMAHAWDAAGVLHVASYGSKDVRSFDAEGALIEVVTPAGSLQSAVNLWFGAEGALFVVDWRAGEVLRFTGASHAEREVFARGLTRAEGACTGPDGRLYVCDWQRNAVLRFDAQSGAPLGPFTRGGGLLQPNGLAFAPASDARPR